MQKRDFLKLSGAAAGVAVISACSQGATGQPASNLSSIVDDAIPIGVEERLDRIVKAQRLMGKHNIDAILLEPGSAMLYFSGVSWWRSERLTAVIIPREGEIGIVTPFFEEPSVRESMTFDADVRSWHEHHNPFALVAGFLKDRNIDSGRIGLEGTVRQFVAVGLAEASPGLEITTAEPVTRGCRMYKSSNEIALMKKANEVTLSFNNKLVKCFIKPCASIWLLDLYILICSRIHLVNLVNDGCALMNGTVVNPTTVIHIIATIHHRPSITIGQSVYPHPGTHINHASARASACTAPHTCNTHRCQRSANSGQCRAGDCD